MKLGYTFQSLVRDVIVSCGYISRKSIPANERTSCAYKTVAVYQHTSDALFASSWQTFVTLAFNYEITSHDEMHLLSALSFVAFAAFVSRQTHARLSEKSIWRYNVTEKVFLLLHHADSSKFTLHSISIYFHMLRTVSNRM